MTNKLLLTMIALLLASTPALAVDKATFVQKAEESGEFEIASSDLAKHKAHGPDVKKFAQQMITDHTEAADKLKTAAANAGVKPERVNKMSAKHAQDMEKLEKAKPSEFDAIYVDIQKKAHEEAVDLFRNYAEGGDNAELRRFAQETLPVLETHLNHVKSITLSKM
jgi:putative membrane protein